MRKMAVVLFALVVVNTVCFGANPFDEFKNTLTGEAKEIVQDTLDNFAKDLGGLMGGGAFRQGKSLGIPGFDIGLRIPAKKINKDNIIMKNADLDSVFLPVLQAEIGLPSNIDLIGLFTSYAESSLMGAGVRYGLFQQSIPGMPCVSAQVLYTTLDVKSGDNKLKANTISAAVVLSINLPVFVPYVGAGMDKTTVEPNAIIPLPESGMKGEATGYRFEAGVNLSLVPFTYLQLGGALLGSDIAYTLGLGLNF